MAAQQSVLARIWGFVKSIFGPDPAEEGRRANQGKADPQQGEAHIRRGGFSI